MRSIPRTCLHLLAGLVCCAAPAAALGQSVPQPIHYGQYPGLDVCLDSCYISCGASTFYPVCALACLGAFGTCDGGCDITCFFSPEECLSCRNECASTLNTCLYNGCEEAYEECHQACAATCIPQYTNSVGTPWFVGSAISGPDEVSGVIHQFGTLDYPYLHLAYVTQEWDANPKTVYIESGLTFANPNIINPGPVVINHPTWLINNTPSNGPVRIQP